MTQTRLTPNLSGALVMMASMASFTVSDTAVKATGGALPLGQLMTLRTTGTLILLTLLAWWFGALDFRLPRRDTGLLLLRCVSEIAAAFFFVTALLNMPLANLVAIIQALPLTITLAAAILFREPVGWRRLSAIVIGFLGVLLIIRPGPEGFNIHALYALGSVVAVTVRDLATRRLSAAVPSLSVSVLTSLGVLVAFGLFSVTEDWQPVDLRLGGLLALSAFFIMLGYLCSVAVMRLGDVSFVAPFRYTGLLWALIAGWVVFGHWPAPLTLLGAAIVVATGVFTLYRERALLRG